jgi:pyruvate carboxylase
MDRALREFRIRGVKTNIPFLENVVSHPDFQAGHVTTTFIEHTPALFRFRAPQDRATRLLNYLGEVIVNGNPEMAGRSRRPPPSAPPSAPPAIPNPRPRAPANSSTNSAPKSSPNGPGNRKRLLVTDTTLRDAHQSLMATRMRTYDMLRVANYVAHQLSGLYSLEMWGGATFDVAMRFLHEDPWERLRKLRAARSPTSASRCSSAPPTPSATPPTPITSSAASSKSPPRKASTSSASSTPSTGSPI